MQYEGYGLGFTDIFNYSNRFSSALKIGGNQPYKLISNIYQCTPSIGATFFHEHDTGLDELLKQADIPMYQAKAVGRNTLRFFNPMMQQAISARVALENELKLALKKISSFFITSYRFLMDAKLLA